MHLPPKLCALLLVEPAFEYLAIGLRYPDLRYRLLTARGRKGLATYDPIRLSLVTRPARWWATPGSPARPGFSRRRVGRLAQHSLRAKPRWYFPRQPWWPGKMREG
jgi:hypothetical protein